MRGQADDTDAKKSCKRESHNIDLHICLACFSTQQLMEKAVTHEIMCYLFKCDPPCFFEVQ